MSADLEIHIDPKACRGAGECVYRAPGSFALDDDDRARLRSPLADDEATLIAAARACPHFAISIRRGDEVLVR